MTYDNGCAHALRCATCISLQCGTCSVAYVLRRRSVFVLTATETHATCYARARARWPLGCSRCWFWLWLRALAFGTSTLTAAAMRLTVVHHGPTLAFNCSR